MTTGSMLSLYSYEVLRVYCTLCSFPVPGFPLWPGPGFLSHAYLSLVCQSLSLSCLALSRTKPSLMLSSLLCASKGTTPPLSASQSHSRVVLSPLTLSLVLSPFSSATLALSRTKEGDGAALLAEKGKSLGGRYLHTTIYGR